MKILAFPAFRNRDSNPYNYLLNKAIEDAGVEVGEFTTFKTLVGKYDLIHIHWPEWYLSNSIWLKALINSSILILALSWAKLRKKKIVWTIHNLFPHSIKHPILNKLFWPIFKKLVDATLSLSEANKKQFLDTHSEFRNRQNGVTYHGLYHEVYENKADKEDATQKLELNADVSACLFLGQLKPYKNIEMLIDLFLSEKCLQDRMLLIAGKFESLHYRDLIVDQIGAANNIKLFEGFVKDAELQYFFAVSDLVILPFKNIFNSGSALMSSSFNVPVLVPYTDNFKEYSQLLPGLIKTYDDTLSGQDILTSMSELDFEFQSAEVNELKWSSIAEETIQLFNGAIYD